MSHRVDLPFFAGQDESFDRKVLPVGPVRAAKNVTAERDGRMVRRDRIQLKGLNDEKGAVTLGQPRDFVDPDMSIWGDIAFNRSVKQFTRLNGQEVIRDLDGNVPAYTTNRALYTAFDQQEGAHHWSPCCVFDANGNLVIACLTGELGVADKYILEVIDPVTFDVIHRKVETITDFNDSVIPATTLRLVEDPLSSHVWLIFRRTQAVPGAVVMKRINTDSSFAVVQNVAGFTASTTSTLDACPVPGSSEFYVADAVSVYRYDNTGTQTASYLPGGGIPNAPQVVSIRSASNRFYHVVGGEQSALVHSNVLAGGDEKAATHSTGGQCISVICREENNTLAWVGWSHGQSTDLTLAAAAPLTSDLAQFNADAPALIFEIEDAANACWAAGPAETGENTGPGGRATNIHVPHETFFLQVFTPPQSITERDAPATVHLLDRRGTVDAKLWAGFGACQVRATDQPFSNPWFDTIFFSQFTGNAAAADRIVSVANTQIHESVFPIQTQAASSALSLDDSGKGAQVSCFWAVAVTDAQRGRTFRQGESLVPGGSVHMADGHNSYLAGYTSGPNLVNVTTTGAAGSLTEGTYLVALTMETTDGNGRVWRSNATTIRTMEVTADDAMNLDIAVPLGVMAQQRGTRVVVYMSEANGNLLFRQFSVGFQAGERRTIVVEEDPNTDTEQLYTQGNVLGNDSPPPGEIFARTRERIWVGGLADSGRVQASKFLRPGVGVEFSDLDNFFVSVDEPVTGLAAVDDSCVVFTRDAIFAVYGAGPNDQGVGAFTTPQRMPGTIGCINPRSVVEHQYGIFFQSRRGLEVLPRGFVGPEWIGQAVRDTLEEHPWCAGSVFIPRDNSIRWLFAKNADLTGDKVLIVYSARSKSWFVWRYDELDVGSALVWKLGRNIGDAEDPLEAHMVLLHTEGTIVYQDVFDEEEQSASNVIETGSLRTAGLNGWNYGRRVNILGEYRGATDVTLEFAFNDEKWLPIDTYTWSLTDADYSVGDPIELELTLPVQLYSTVRFRLSWTNSGTTQSFYAHGISVFFDRAQEGPRVPERAKG